MGLNNEVCEQVLRRFVDFCLVGLSCLLRGHFTILEIKLLKYLAQRISARDVGMAILIMLAVPSAVFYLLVWLYAAPMVGVQRFLQFLFIELLRSTILGC